MCWFRKKKIYLLIWNYYGPNDTMKYSDYIVARDIGEAWRKHKEEHPLATYCISIEEVKERN